MKYKKGDVISFIDDEKFGYSIILTNPNGMELTELFSVKNKWSFSEILEINEDVRIITSIFRPYFKWKRL